MEVQKRSFLSTLGSTVLETAGTAAAGGAIGAAGGFVLGAVKPVSKNLLLETFADAYVSNNGTQAVVKTYKETLAGAKGLHDLVVTNADAIHKQALRAFQGDKIGIKSASATLNATLSNADAAFRESVGCARGSLRNFTDDLFKKAKGLKGEARTGADFELFKEVKKVAKKLDRRNTIGAGITLGIVGLMLYKTVSGFISNKKHKAQPAEPQQQLHTPLKTVQG
ncbi:hypothetical protein tpqmel_0283 [Candidatus Gastranaerophilus sp. (ex Termes propinquus)]|nr:hypothetical protein tpqmel_0283 [Candidatus Gastranaerophilus sp. (ex Termes propinquus)]